MGNNTEKINTEVPKKALKTVKAKSDAKRTRVERFADLMTEIFGSISFLIANVAIFTAWVLINTGHMKVIPVFDPFPFNFLTMTVSLEAIILSVVVLISQNRNLKVDDLREELHLQVNLIAEKEITKIMKMLTLLLQKNGIDISHDPELKSLIKPVDEEEIGKKLEKEIL